MIFGRGILTGLFAILLASSGEASAAGQLDCMAQSYDAGQLAKIAEASEGFTINKSRDDKSQGFADIAIMAAANCADQRSWTDDQIYHAMFYEIGRLGEAAYRHSGNLTAEQMVKLDRALTNQDRTELWALMEKTVAASINGEEANLSLKDQTKLGIFIIGSGLGSDEATGEKVGGLLGMMAIQRYAQREFEALEKKE